MTNSEFDTAFDVLYNNITSNKAPGLNSYEKSIFLTKAQEQLVYEYYNSRVDNVGGGFDGGQRRQYDFSSIIKTHECEEVNKNNLILIDNRSRVFKFPKDFYLTINEVLSDNKYQYSVMPISFAEYKRILAKPYTLPIKKTVWRLISGQENWGEDGILVEIIGVIPKEVRYLLRYIPELSPIILSELSEYGENITINGKHSPIECKLPEVTHQEILERAVTLAKIAWQGATYSQAAAATQRGE